MFILLCLARHRIICEPLTEISSLYKKSLFCLLPCGVCPPALRLARDKVERLVMGLSNTRGVEARVWPSSQAICTGEVKRANKAGVWSLLWCIVYHIRRLDLIRASDWRLAGYLDCDFLRLARWHSAATRGHRRLSLICQYPPACLRLFITGSGLLHAGLCTSSSVKRGHE